MKEEFVSYECAKRLKECGFDCKCDHYYCAFDNETDVRFWGVHPPQSNNAFRQPDNKVIADAPSLSLAQKWLREVKGINVRVNYLFDEQLWFADWIELGTRYYDSSDLHFRTYEEALSDGIDAVLFELTQDED